MLKRKVYSELLNWKEKRRKEGIKKCLLIKGASQVGKTTVIREFAKNEYESFIYVNLMKQHPIRRIFDGEHSAEEIYKKITANLPNVDLIEKNTLFFIDEIQMSPDAMNALKNLAWDLRFDVIAVGMLPDITYQEEFLEKKEGGTPSFKKYVKEIWVRPLDFEEFLWSYEFDDRRIKALRDCVEYDRPIPAYMHGTLENLFREYIVVGGMPDAVNQFKERKDFARVMKAQLSVISRYKYNITSQATPHRARLILRCYESMPKQLNNELKKFKYSRVEKSATARKYAPCVNWLLDAGIGRVSYNISQGISPLSDQLKENQYKLYMADTGLLSCMYGFETKRAVLNNTIKGNMRTALYENAIAQCLAVSGYELYYYKPDDNHMVEFVFEKKGEVIPVEVKAGENVSVSLENFIKDFEPKMAYKFIAALNRDEGDVKMLPHYFVPFI